MTHHAAPRRLLAALLLAPALALTAACGGSDDEEAMLVTTTLDVRITAARAVRGVQLDLRHDDRLTVASVDPGSALAGASCAENVTDGRVRLACVATADVAAPFTAWTIDVRHDTRLSAEDAVTGLTCQLADGLGAAVAGACALEL